MHLQIPLCAFVNLETDLTPHVLLYLIHVMLQFLGKISHLYKCLMYNTMPIIGPLCSYPSWIKSTLDLFKVSLWKAAYIS